METLADRNTAPAPPLVIRILVPIHYDNPPLVEAIYEVQFRDSPGWSELSYKRLEERLAPRFDGRRDVLEAVGLQVQMAPDGKLVPAPTPSIPRKRRMWTKDEGELVQFTSTMCAYNILARYRGFEHVTNDIEQLFGMMMEEAQPTATEFLGQRYINRVVLPKGEQDPSAFFEVYPRLPLDVASRPFALQIVTHRFEDGEVALNLAYQGDDDGRTAFFLDVYARSTRPIPAVAREIRMWQERAHPFVRSSFEAVLTAKSRELFRVQGWR